ncbi:MAG: 3-oxoacyl-ACP synthase [Pseudonocardia sp.]|nr:3-oxoacyl-ACP synthase [Pseudonocardia sp.]
MKLGDGLGVRSARTWLPATVETTAQALAAGRITSRDVEETGGTEVPVSQALAAPEMAVLAAKDALDAAGWAPGELDITAHAWIHHQGHDFWSPAHYVASRLGAVAAVPVGVQAMCNGGALALEMAAARLLADPDTHTALVTTGDRFADEGFDRWSGDYGVFYGDGATAVLLHRRDDAADELTLLGIATAAISHAETLHRGRDPFSPTSRWHSDRVDVKRTKKAHIEDIGLTAFYDGAGAALRTVVEVGLTQSGLDHDDPRVRLIALPRVGASVRRETYHPAVVGLTKAEIVDLGATTGHLGAGDLGANLTAIVAGGLLAPGEIALVISAGGGFSFSCAVVRRPHHRAESST